MDTQAVIENLQREVRWTRRLSISLATVFVLWVASVSRSAEQPAADTIVARRIVLVDQAGKTRAILGQDDARGAFLLLGDHAVEISSGSGSEGVPRVAMVAGERTAELRVGPAVELNLYTPKGSADIAAGAGAGLHFNAQQAHAALGVSAKEMRLRYDTCEPKGPCADRSGVDLRLVAGQPSLSLDDKHGDAIWHKP